MIPAIKTTDVIEVKGAKVVANTTDAENGNAFFFFVSDSGREGYDQFFFDEIGETRAVIEKTAKFYGMASTDEEAAKVYESMQAFAK
jgi:hypothetical protein